MAQKDLTLENASLTCWGNADCNEFNEIMMPTIRYTSLLISLFFIAAQSSAMAQVLTNGGFESGDFTGWEVTNNSQNACQTDWNVSSIGGVGATGCQPGFSGSFPGEPVEGEFAAYNSFDGAAGTLFQLSQTFEVPATVVDAQLSWQDTVNIDYGFLRTFRESSWSTCMTTPGMYYLATF